MCTCPEKTLMAFYRAASEEAPFQEKYPPIVGNLVKEFGSCLTPEQQAAVTQGDANSIANDTSPAMRDFLLAVANDPDYPGQLKNIHEEMIRYYGARLTPDQIEIIVSGDAVRIADEVRAETAACPPCPSQLSSQEYPSSMVSTEAMITLWTYFSSTTR